jgi:hypothetical protein
MGFKHEAVVYLLEMKRPESEQQGPTLMLPPTLGAKERRALEKACAMCAESAVLGSLLFLSLSEKKEIAQQVHLALYSCAVCAPFVWLVVWILDLLAGFVWYLS